MKTNILKHWFSMRGVLVAAGLALSVFGTGCFAYARPYQQPVYYGGYGGYYSAPATTTYYSNGYNNGYYGAGTSYYGGGSYYRPYYGGWHGGWGGGWGGAQYSAPARPTYMQQGGSAGVVIRR